MDYSFLQEQLKEQNLEQLCNAIKLLGDSIVASNKEQEKFYEYLNFLIQISAPPCYLIFIIFVANLCYFAYWYHRYGY